MSEKSLFDGRIESLETTDQEDDAGSLQTALAKATTKHAELNYTCRQQANSDMSWYYRLKTFRTAPSVGKAEIIPMPLIKLDVSKKMAKVVAIKTKMVKPVAAKKAKPAAVKRVKVKKVVKPVKAAKPAKKRGVGKYAALNALVDRVFEAMIPGKQHSATDFAWVPNFDAKTFYKTMWVLEDLGKVQSCGKGEAAVYVRV